MHATITINSKVIFDTDKLELFIEETNSDSEALKQYQQLVLSTIGKQGVVKELDPPFAIISYPDVESVKIPVKYLVLSPPVS